MIRRVLPIAAIVLGVAATLHAQNIPDVTMPTQRNEVPASQSQGGSQQELVIPPVAQPQRAATPPDQVLIIPQASHDFVGRWGGRLRLQGVRGRAVNAPPDSIVSLKFGDSNGSVFMRTTVFAPPGSNVLKTDAEALTPHEISLRIDGYDVDTIPPVRHVEKLKLSLDVGSNVLKCTKRVELYVRGAPTPFAKIDYEGDLAQLSDSSHDDLAREVLDSGGVPQATIDESRPAYAPR
ncbi:MAG: hypothetical protein ACREQF_00235 [Candidatus Binataceae bacterium]